MVLAYLDEPDEPMHPEAPVFAYQLMTGWEYTMCDDNEGDPLTLQAPAAGQYLDRYVFNTDDVFDFDYDHIIVVRRSGSTIELDCAGELEGFTQVGGTSWEVLRFFIDDPLNTNDCQDGAHVISGDQPFGLSVVDTSYANSYGYLGGVGVRPINPDPIIE